MICSLCGFPKGKHSAFDYYCPADATFTKYTSQKFRLKVDLVAENPSRKKQSTADIEREVARRLVKALEINLGLYDLTGPTKFDRANLIENLLALKAGYNI